MSDLYGDFDVKEIGMQLVGGVLILFFELYIFLNFGNNCMKFGCFSLYYFKSTEEVCICLGFKIFFKCRGVLCCKIFLII